MEQDIFDINDIIIFVATISDITMAKVQLDVPDELHLKVKQLQLNIEASGTKSNLKDLYYEIIAEGLKTYKPKSSAK